MNQNKIMAYFSKDFRLIDKFAQRSIPYPHRLAIRRELEKLLRFPYKDLIPPRKTLKSLGSIAGGVPLYGLRPHGPDKTQYRIPLVSPRESIFLLLGFFPRKDACFDKEIEVAEKHYMEIKNGEATYEPIDLQNNFQI